MKHSTSRSTPFQFGRRGHGNNPTNHTLVTWLTFAYARADDARTGASKWAWKSYNYIRLIVYEEINKIILLIMFFKCQLTWSLELSSIWCTINLLYAQQNYILLQISTNFIGYIRAISVFHLSLNMRGQ